MGKLTRIFSNVWHQIDYTVRAHLIGTVTAVKCRDCDWRFELPDMDNMEFQDILEEHGCRGRFVINVQQLWGLRNYPAPLTLTLDEC
jgi:hypothetical protein